MTSGTTTDGSGRRAQAALIGLVLLIGIVAIASIGILLIGADANEQTKEETENERVKQNFLELNSEADAVARSDNGTREVNFDLPEESDAAVREDATGRIWVNRTNYTTLNEEEIVNESIGAIRYTRDDGTTFAFQGGGVWREEGNKTRMLSPPSFAYKLNKSGDNPTLTLPIVTTTGDRRLNTGDVRIQKNRTVAPTNDVSIVEGDLVTVKVKSRWYVGWAEYFREIADETGVTVDHQNNTATLRLVRPETRKTVIEGVISGAAADTLKITNNVGLKSFNSTTDTCHRCSASDSSELIAAGDVTLDGNLDVEGNLTAGGKLDFDHNKANVTNDVAYNSVECEKSPCPDEHIGGTASTNPSVVDYESVDEIIDGQANRAKSDNNNSEDPDIVGNSFDPPGGSDCSSTCDLYPGTYFVEDLDLTSGEKILFDTQGRTINLVVNGTAKLSGGNSVKLKVIGNGRVNVYINSEDPSSTDLVWDQTDSAIPGNRTSKLWIYMDSDAEAEFSGGQSDFYGVLFGPGDGTGGGVNITFINQVWTYGALVGNVSQIDNHVRIVYDEALANSKTLPPTANVPELTFLHASVYELCLRGSAQSTEDCDP